MDLFPVYLAGFLTDTQDDISPSQDHTRIFSHGSKAVGQPIHMVCTLLPLRQEGIQLFLSLDIHRAKANDIPGAKEGKERLEAFNMLLSSFLAAFLCPYHLLILSLEE